MSEGERIFLLELRVAYLEGKVESLLAKLKELDRTHIVYGEKK